MRSPDVTSIDVADETGTVLATVTPLSAYTRGAATPSVKTVADRDYFHLARAGTSSVVGVRSEPLTLDHPVVIAAPIRSGFNQVVAGVLIGEIRGNEAVHLLQALWLS